MQQGLDAPSIWNVLRTCNHLSVPGINSVAKRCRMSSPAPAPAHAPAEQPPALASRSEPAAGLNRHRNDIRTALVFLSPIMGGFMLFVLFPLVYSFLIAFTNRSLKPAIVLEYLGLDNFWRLIGFRAVEGGGSLAAAAAFFGSYAIVTVGLLSCILALLRGWQGLRAAGWLMLAGGALMISMAVFSPTAGVGWALTGIVYGFIALFFLLDEDTDFAGKAAAAPVLAIAGAFLVSFFEPWFTRNWSPNDFNFYRYLYNTLYLMIAVPAQIGGSLLLAILLSKPLLKATGTTKAALTLVFLAIGIIGLLLLWLIVAPDAGVLWMTFWGIAALGTSVGMVAFRTLFYLPTFTAGVAVMLLWKQIFNPDFGLLNESLRIVFGLVGMDAELPRWLLDPAWAKPGLILMNLWIFIGGANMLLYLAGLSNIPRDLYEAAQIDGASTWAQFKNITWPQLAPTTFFIIVMTTIAGIQGGFEQARVMTNGGPAGSTKTLSYYVYEKAFEELELGYASGIAWILFLIIFVLTLVNWKFGNEYVND